MTDQLPPDRDRDKLGRPHNARPRDALGRPMARDSISGPTEEVDYSQLTTTAALELAQDLLDRARPFEAHDVFEAMWERTLAPQRTLWQGLAQLSVAITHLLRGNVTGGDRLLRRARANLLTYMGAVGTAGLGADSGNDADVDSDSDCDVDVRGIVAWAESRLAQLDAGINDGGAPLQFQPPRLRPLLPPASRSSGIGK